MYVRWLLMGTAALALSGCASIGGLFGGDDEEDAQARQQAQIDAIMEEVQSFNEDLPSMEPEVLQASGYGAVNEQAGNLSPQQQRLMAMRSSKLDAYRTLAERVYGTAIVGNTTVENLVVQDDRYRAYVDTYIYGARVVMQSPLPDGGYETIVEMVIDQGFRNCLVNERAWRTNTRCQSDMVHSLGSMERNDLRRQGLDQRESGLYFLQ